MHVQFDICISAMHELAYARARKVCEQLKQQQITGMQACTRVSSLTWLLCLLCTSMSLTIASAGSNLRVTDSAQLVYLAGVMLECSFTHQDSQLVTGRLEPGFTS